MTTERVIEIVGGMAQVIDKTIVRQAALTDFMPNIERRPPITMFHARNMIFTHWDESNPTDRRVKIIAELEPAIRRIVKSGRAYRVAIPWTYFVFAYKMQGVGDPMQGENWSLRDYYVFHAPNRINQLTDRVWTAWVPNVYMDGRICFGSTGVDTYQPLASRIEQTVNNFYLTAFNDDVTREHPLPFNGRNPNGWALWVNATEEQGLNAYTTFPEWRVTNNTAGIYSWTIGEILTGQTPANLAHRNRVDDIGTPFLGERIRVAQVIDQVPPIEFPVTFGRAEQWARGLEPTQRGRLLTALLNIQADDPDAIQQPVPEPVDPTQPTEDGGEPVA